MPYVHVYSYSSMSIGLSNTSNISPNVITPLSNHFLLNSSLTLDYTSLVYSLLHPALGRLENFFRPGQKEICHQSPTVLDIWSTFIYFWWTSRVFSNGGTVHNYGLDTIKLKKVEERLTRRKNIFSPVFSYIFLTITSFEKQKVKKNVYILQTLRFKIQCSNEI